MDLKDIVISSLLPNSPCAVRASPDTKLEISRNGRLIIGHLDQSGSHRSAGTISRAFSVCPWTF